MLESSKEFPPNIVDEDGQLDFTMVSVLADRGQLPVPEVYTGA